MAQAQIRAARQLEPKEAKVKARPQDLAKNKVKVKIKKLQPLTQTNQLKSATQTNRLQSVMHLKETLAISQTSLMPEQPTKKLLSPQPNATTSYQRRLTPHTQLKKAMKSWVLVLSNLLLAL